VIISGGGILAVMAETGRMLPLDTITVLLLPFSEVFLPNPARPLSPGSMSQQIIKIACALTS